MRLYLYIAALCIVAVVFIAPSLEKFTKETAPELAQKQSKKQARPLHISANANEQFVVGVLLNGSRAQALIDTGASRLTIPRSVALRAGIQLSESDFQYPVSTASGRTLAARANLQNLQIGTLEALNQEAMILKDEDLNVVLIGMPTLNALGDLSVTMGRLVINPR
ncbi:retropepsin-like aspartic protease family protein [Polycladidibacter hongkongensis]|uniref:retropepsin-like aspartic protease family protein n=1 Tax=Polycladidibacter hongkongensis TaxID=1647556 RepID=UPI00082A82D3|nr:TIGR02281 family clan AA aspartic protease [Pseudovibrio hongkongensis]